MSYRYEEKRNGSIYVYEISSYWDKEKKQSRQRRVYLGKKNQSTGKLEAKLNKHPISSVGVGGVHLLREISKQLNLPPQKNLREPTDSFEEANFISFEITCFMRYDLYSQILSCPSFSFSYFLSS